ncbi:hypothetical protein Hanom_Chr02g00158881 [Helianthus anomalus]
MLIRELRRLKLFTVTFRRFFVSSQFGEMILSYLMFCIYLYHDMYTSHIDV